MKKVLSIFILALVAVQFAFAGDVITQDAKLLPLTARNFINQYFSKPHISHIKIESEILQTKKYEVLLTDRTEIDFDKKGNWLEVDCKKSAVPEALIPAPVKEYVKTNFPREIITKIERGRTGMEVELNNDYSLKFNKKENLSVWTTDFLVNILTLYENDENEDSNVGDDVHHRLGTWCMQ